MLRGHIWPSRAFPTAAQEKILREAGVSKRVIYVDDIETAIGELRAGDRLAVAGFRGLGRNRDAIIGHLARIHAKGCAVTDAATALLSTGKHCHTLIDGAVKALANERRGPRKRTKKDRRMPWDQVAPIYFDPLISNKELERRVADGYSAMSYTTMWRHFKKRRGAITGRPSAARLAAIV